jgi:DNA-binding MarR family transcriptional regulator
METKETVLQVLHTASKPLKAGDIAERSGIDKKLVEKAIKQLSAEDKIFSPVRCFWQKKS